MPRRSDNDLFWEPLNYNDDPDTLVWSVQHFHKDPIPFRYSDDMDDWLANCGMESYTERAAREYKQREAIKGLLRQELWKMGKKALPAVRSGLNRLGTWRRILLEFIEEFGGSEEDKEVLRKLTVRQRDPLADEARQLLRKWGVPTEGLRPPRRTKPTKTEIVIEERMAYIVDLCREPMNNRLLCKTVGLWNRRNFENNYLSPLRYGGHLEFCGKRGPHRNSHVATEKGLAWLEQRLKEGKRNKPEGVEPKGL